MWTKTLEKAFPTGKGRSSEQLPHGSKEDPSEETIQKKEELLNMGRTFLRSIQVMPHSVTGTRIPAGEP